jgi:hypothetical protein
VEQFFTTVGCIDGRSQLAVVTYARDLFKAAYPDTITGPGLAGQLAAGLSDQLLVDLREQLAISLDGHRSHGIVVHGHEDCAGHRVADDIHKQHVLAAARLIRELIDGRVLVRSVFVSNSAGVWTAQPLDAP